MPNESSEARALLAWLAAVDRHWRRIGVPIARRLQLRGDLERDVAEALDSGASVADLTCDGPAEFAERVAHESDLAPTTHRPFLGRWRASQSISYDNVIVTCLVGALVGAAVSAYVVFPNLYLEALPWFASALLVDVAAAVVALGFGLGAVALRFPADPTLRPTLLFVGIGMSLGGLVSVAPTVAVAHTFGYSDSAPVVLLEVAMVAMCCAAGIAAGRWTAARRSSQTPTESRPAAER